MQSLYIIKKVSSYCMGSMTSTRCHIICRLKMFHGIMLPLTSRGIYGAKFEPRELRQFPRVSAGSVPGPPPRDPKLQFFCMGIIAAPSWDCKRLSRGVKAWPQTSGFDFDSGGSN